MEKREKLTEIEIIKKNINKEIKNIQTKLNYTRVVSNTISFLTIFLNIVIIGLSIWALTMLIVNLSISNSSSNQTSLRDIIMPIVVLLFTIFLFIFSIMINIHVLKSKDEYLQRSYEEYKAIILKINHSSLDQEQIDKIIKIIEAIQKRDFNNQKLSYKEIIKNALEG